MPLELAAAKSSIAHTEPAAGAVGLAGIAARLRQTTASAFLHLRGLNPYVQSIAAGSKGRRGWLARRQPTAMHDEARCVEMAFFPLNYCVTPVYAPLRVTGAAARGDTPGRRCLVLCIL